MTIFKFSKVNVFEVKKWEKFNDL